MANDGVSVYDRPEAPFVSTSDTSLAAARRLSVERRSMLYKMIVAHVRAALWDGKTREEIAYDLELPGDTVRPRVIAAIRNGDLMESGRTRKTHSGSQAAVLIAKVPTQEGG